MRPGPGLPAAPRPCHPGGTSSPRYSTLLVLGYAEELLAFQLHGKLGVEAEEVDEFSRSVDLPPGSRLPLPGGRPRGQW